MAEQQNQPVMPTGKIKTPWAQQWKRIRYQLFPVLAMTVAVAATAYLWTRHYAPLDGVGVVRVVEVTIASKQDGRLVDLPDGILQMHAPVAKGQVIARMDDSELLAGLKVLQTEMSRLQLEIPAHEEAIRLEQSARGDRIAEESRRLTINVESLQLTVMQLEAQRATDRVEADRQQALLDIVKGLADKDAASKREMIEASMRRDVVAQHLKGTEQSLETARRQLESARERLNAQTQPGSPSMEVLLAPLRAAIETQRAKLDELRLQLKNVNITSPIDGRITAIYRYPHQTVRAGEPIICITSERGNQIVSYVLQDQHVTPVVGMPVEVRSRNGNHLMFSSVVQSVGPAIEKLPNRVEVDSKRTEWGLPVLIGMPSDFHLLPGELVDVRFRPDSGL